MKKHKHEYYNIYNKYYNKYYNILVINIILFSYVNLN